MAKSKKELEQEKKLRRDIQQEDAKAYEAAKKREADLIKIKIRNGELTLKEQEELDKAREDAHKNAKAHNR